VLKTTTNTNIYQMMRIRLLIPWWILALLVIIKAHFLTKMYIAVLLCLYKVTPITSHIQSQCRRQIQCRIDANIKLKQNAHGGTVFCSRNRQAQRVFGAAEWGKAQCRRTADADRQMHLTCKTYRSKPTMRLQADMKTKRTQMQISWWSKT
jgi:hypothetical protein